MTPRMSARARALVVASLVAGSSLYARASDAAPAGSGEVAAAQRWFKSGLVAVRAGDLPAARRAFGAAHALVPSADILWNLAITERKLGEGVAALEHLRAYLVSADARSDRKKLAEEELLPELELTTAHLAIAEPDGATVMVDGRVVPASSTLDVAPGIHAVVVRCDGRERTLAIDAPAGVTTRLPPENVRADTARPNDDAASAMRTTNETRVTDAPAVGPSAAELAVSRVMRGAPSGAASPPFGRTAAVIGLGGAALLTIAGGVYFTIDAQSSQQEADRLQARTRNDDLSCRRSGSLCDDLDTARSAAQRSSVVGTALLVTGGVLGGAAVAAWVLWPGAPARVAPSAGKDGAGFTVVGRF